MELQPIRRCRPGLLVLALLAGCAGELHYLNPYAHSKWVEDEQYAPTFSTRLMRFRDLRREAAAMPPAQQQGVVAQMVAALESEPNPLLRREAVAVLGRLQVPAAEPPLLQALQDPDPELRIAACQAWEERGAERAGAQAIEALAAIVRTDDDLDVRIAATEALGQIGDPLAYAGLQAALEDPDPALRFVATEALQEATGQPYGNDVGAWRQYLQGQRPVVETPSVVERLRRLF